MADQRPKLPEPPTEVSQETEKLVKKRLEVRQRLATSLLAVGGVLFAAAILYWFVSGWEH